MSASAEPVAGHGASAELAGRADDLRSKLHEWGGDNRRDLPWRATRDPWAVLVSEVMSQQTQIDRVVPRWHRFMQRWPRTSDMAAAELGVVLIEWKGLGYPRRARWLHQAAGLIEAEHGGGFPTSLDALLALPGVGSYTARAVMAFAFEADVGVLDTNVGRILARIVGRRLTVAEAQELADDLVPPGRGWDWNTAMLDLGATVCRPTPECRSCPLERQCSWRTAGRPVPDPALRSAAVSRPQARFEGSLRQARGRLLGRLGGGPLAIADLDPSEFGPHETAVVVESLVADGLAVVDGDSLRLP